jgi:UDP-glucose 4-epimerase
VIAATQSSSTIKYVNYNEAYGEGFEDMQRRIPDIAKARSWFGYAPTQSLDDIIKSVVAYCRSSVEASTLQAAAAAD